VDETIAALSFMEDRQVNAPTADQHAELLDMIIFWNLA
jgi:hypothetical protein